MRTLTCLALALLAAGSFAQPVPNELEQMWKREGALKFDNMYPRRSYFGKMGSPNGFSADDRYLAYLWNPYDVRGNDLWLFDTVTKTSKRLTSIEMMAKFDRDAKLAIDFYKKDDERLAKWATLSDAEWRAERQKFKEEQEKKTKPDPSYAGISQVAWANKTNEFLMVFKGDIWRWKLGADMPTRITQTRGMEMRVEYLPDDSGFIFMRGNDVFRIKFGRIGETQINPPVPAGATMTGFSISPDGTQALVTTDRDLAPDRQVDWIVYRDRFAQARKTTRSVSDDKFNSETVFYLFDITDEGLSRVDDEIKPYEIYKWGGGEEWEYVSLAQNPWSPDGANFVFATFKRDKKEFKVREADLKRKKVRVVYEGTSNGEHQTPMYSQPFYSGDGKDIIVMLDKSGWRQVHVLERVRGAERALTTGNFETQPLTLSADKKAIIVQSSKESLARRDIYRIELADGKWTRLSKQDGEFSPPIISRKSDKAAGMFQSWTSMRELNYLGDGQQVPITASNKKEEFSKNLVLKPELFKFKNRHGQEISGFMFLPPAMERTPVKRPLFIYVYGGPLGDSNTVSDGNFGSSEFMFNQYLAANLGYITCAIDPRGTTGYSAEHGRANFENPGTAQTEDLVDCVKFMQSKYNVDSTRVGLTGWSFGGYQTQHAMYNAPDVFTLGIAGAGPTEWQNYNTWYTGGVIGNTPNADGNYLDKFSLTNMAKNLKSPLMLLHGIEDTNVLFQDTVKVYRRLLQAGKGPLVELSLDPTGAHGMGGDMDTRDRHMIYLSFLLRRWGWVQG
ncbi:MAG: S9 family peptidase [Chthonomonas sp.]|nr:S9 family peptidase [Chthonomonas sp.]